VLHKRDVEKSSEGKQDKEKICEIAEFTGVNEHIKQIFDAVLLSAVILRHPLKRDVA
jgi:hypothetical protein